MASGCSIRRFDPLDQSVVLTLRKLTIIYALIENQLSDVYIEFDQFQIL